MHLLPNNQVRTVYGTFSIISCRSSSKFSKAIKQTEAKQFIDNNIFIDLKLPVVRRVASQQDISRARFSSDNMRSMNIATINEENVKLEVTKCLALRHIRT